MTAEAIIREFMQRRLNAKPQPWLGHKDAEIKTVLLDEDFDDGWSEYTPGEGWLLRLECRDQDNNNVYSESHSGVRTLDFIRELAQFAADVYEEAKRARG